MKFLSFLIVVVLAGASRAMADAPEGPDLATRYERYYVSYYLNDDGSHIESYEWARNILKERAVEGAKQTSIVYSTSVQKAEVVDAYTRKADGRRIDAPKSNFQIESNSGKDKNAPAFSDLTTLTVVFPEVAVGDTVVLSYKVTQIEPIFPGHFSVMGFFPKTVAYDDVRIKIDAPASRWTQYDIRELTETKTEQAGRKRYEWTYQNKAPIKATRRNYSVYDVEKDPGFAFSTFQSYAAIAEAYGARAQPKAIVTERIQQLADEIVRGKETPQERARALYDWVVTNISYAGNDIGVGSVVPRDLSFVLDNKMGDCKDHTTLLQALLAAKGIPSVQALINAGSVYQLPKTPVLATVNHVINWLPSLNLFVDSTAASIPFGMLPPSVVGKPVLLVDGFTEGTKTPIPPLGSNRQAMKSVVKINEDGSMTGDVEISSNGLFAITTRAQWKRMSKDQEEELVKHVFKKSGYIGSGTIDKDDPTPLLDTYNFKVKFGLQEFLHLPGRGAFQIAPLFASEAPIHGFLQAAVEPEETVDIACSSGVSAEEYTYQFPKTMQILAVPEDMVLANDFLSYRATYRKKGNTLTVKRTLDDKTPGNVCSPALISEYKKFALKVQQNVKSQIVYK